MIFKNHIFFVFIYSLILENSNISLNTFSERKSPLPKADYKHTLHLILLKQIVLINKIHTYYQTCSSNMHKSILC